MEYRVRVAYDGDIPWILSELREFGKFSGFLSLFPEERYAEEKLKELIERHVVMVCMAVDEVVGSEDAAGFIAGYVGPHPWNPQAKVLTEAFWWVAEKYRRSRAGLLLLNAYTDWGRENCDMVTMALEANSPVRQETLTKRGYKLKELSFVLQPGEEA